MKRQLVLLLLLWRQPCLDGFLSANVRSSGGRAERHNEVSKDVARCDIVASRLWSTSSSEESLTTQEVSDSSELAPQVLATGYSQALEMATALEEAVDMALEALPPAMNAANARIDLAVVSVSSIYDGSSKPSDVVPTVLKAASSYGQGIQQLIGCTSGGFISSLANLNDYDFSMGNDAGDRDEEEGDDDDGDSNSKTFRACRPIEREGVPGVTVLLAILPDVNVQSFHVMGDDVSDDFGKLSSDSWRRSIGLNRWVPPEDDNLAVMVLPSPAFQKDLDDLLRGMEMHMGSGSKKANIFGAIASTVSSLSRARLFRYDAAQGDACIQTLADGCVGVAMSGDVEVRTMVAQGAKAVGGVYQIVKGQESTISAIALDEAATELVRTAEEEEANEHEDDEDGEDPSMLSNKEKLAQAYAKARIPKPVLAEANFLMRTLSDDDQAFMRKALLVGLERSGSLGRSPSELVRLAEGKGPGFTVHQVASAAMKDGSVTLSLGSVDIKPGQRMRFYVRQSAFAKKEVEALWMGYKRRVLAKTMEAKGGTSGKTTTFTPTGCFVFPTLDRGNKFFLGKSGFESEAIMEFIPRLPCVLGFFCNGVIGSLDSHPEVGPRELTALAGSASGYMLFGSKSGRPIYVPGRAAAEATKAQEEKSAQEAEDKRLDEEDTAREKRFKSFAFADTKAPRDESGELIIRRREIHSGRAMTVSTVEWSVAEKTANPTSALEGFMWDKETEVDRFRERVPLANLVSQCRLSAVDPTKPKPRDWLGPVKEAAAKGSFVIIPECKRMEPSTGSLRKRYDIMKLTKEFTNAGVPAISVNCDGILFGGSLEDLTKARDGTIKAAMQINDSEDGVVVPPVLASDLLLYPYQLYKMRLAGADAVNLMVAALEAKDLVYLTKIAASLQIQCLVTVTSGKQIENLSVLPAGSVDGLIISNRNFEDFSFDMTGQQALDILASNALKDFREKNGDDVVILAEGRIGIVTGQKKGGSPQDYIDKLQKAGAIGAVVAAGLVPDESRKSPLESLLQTS